MSAKRSEPTGWVGWVFFASLMMLLVGGFQIIAGLVGIFKDDFYVVTSSHLVAFNVSTWGWIHMLLGLVILLGGLALLNGATWARMLGIFLAFLSLFANMAFLNAYPWWSILIITIDVLVIYSLAVHGGELRE